MPVLERYSMAIAVDEQVSISIGKISSSEHLYTDALKRDFDRSSVISSLIEQIRGMVSEIKTSIALEQIDSISLSFIGLINKNTKQVLDVARPTWKVDVPKPIDLAEMLHSAIPEISLKFFQSSNFTVFNDATAAAIGERYIGLGSKIEMRNAGEAFCFIRVGEGVNAGILIDGQPWSGGLHPELGHIKSPDYSPPNFKKPTNKIFIDGICPRHGNCLEGKISEPALLQRWQANSLKELMMTNQNAFETTAHDIAYLCSVLTMLLAPIKIVLAGSVISEQLCKKIHKHYLGLIQEYPSSNNRLPIQEYIVISEMKEKANLMGALYFATAALEANRN